MCYYMSKKWCLAYFKINSSKVLLLLLSVLIDTSMETFGMFLQIQFKSKKFNKDLSGWKCTWHFLLKNTVFHSELLWYPLSSQAYFSDPILSYIIHYKRQFKNGSSLKQIYVRTFFIHFKIKKVINPSNRYSLSL